MNPSVHMDYGAGLAHGKMYRSSNTFFSTVEIFHAGGMVVRQCAEPLDTRMPLIPYVVGAVAKGICDCYVINARDDGKTREVFISSMDGGCLFECKPSSDPVVAKAYGDLVPGEVLSILTDPDVRKLIIMNSVSDLFRLYLSTFCVNTFIFDEGCCVTRYGMMTMMKTAVREVNMKKIFKMLMCNSSTGWLHERVSSLHTAHYCVDSPVKAVEVQTGLLPGPPSDLCGYLKWIEKFGLCATPTTSAIVQNIMPVSKSWFRAEEIQNHKVEVCDKSKEAFQIAPKIVAMSRAAPVDLDISCNILEKVSRLAVTVAPASSLRPYARSEDLPSPSGVECNTCPKSVSVLAPHIVPASYDLLARCNEPIAHSKRDEQGDISFCVATNVLDGSVVKLANPLGLSSTGPMADNQSSNFQYGDMRDVFGESAWRDKFFSSLVHFARFPNYWEVQNYKGNRYIGRVVSTAQCNGPGVVMSFPGYVEQLDAVFKSDPDYTDLLPIFDFMKYMRVECTFSGDLHTFSVFLPYEGKFPLQYFNDSVMKVASRPYLHLTCTGSDARKYYGTLVLAIYSSLSWRVVDGKLHSVLSGPRNKCFWRYGVDYYDRFPRGNNPYLRLVRVGDDRFAPQKRLRPAGCGVDEVTDLIFNEDGSLKIQPGSFAADVLMEEDY